MKKIMMYKLDELSRKARKKIIDDTRKYIWDYTEESTNFGQKLRNEDCTADIIEIASENYYDKNGNFLEKIEPWKVN